MSRLDSFIRRLEAQRACLDMAAHMIEGLDGPVLELGLGNGRTYDHLRELFPERKIFACERQIAAHPLCIPPAELLLLGDMRQTLPVARGRLEGRVALAHLDPGTGEIDSSRALARELAPLIAPLLRSGGLLVSEPEIELLELVALAPPPNVARGRYHLYRRVMSRS